MTHFNQGRLVIRFWIDGIAFTLLGKLRFCQQYFVEHEDNCYAGHSPWAGSRPPADISDLPRHQTTILMQ